MNLTLIKALAAVLPTSLLSIGAAIHFSRDKRVTSVLQLLGAGSLVVVALIHICEALHLFPSMHWGLERSAGHYLDVVSVVMGLVLFPIGYLLHALGRRPA